MTNVNHNWTMKEWFVTDMGEDSVFAENNHAALQVPPLATFQLHSVPAIQVSPAVDVQTPPMYATPLFDCYGPPPPAAFRMSFSEMLESDHDMHEVAIERYH